VAGRSVLEALNFCDYTPDAGGWHFYAAWGLALVWGTLIFLLITEAGRESSWAGPHGGSGLTWIWAVVGVYLASAIPLAFITIVVEHRSLSPLLGWHGSLALELLDPAVLPAMYGLCAWAWQDLPQWAPGHEGHLIAWRTRTWQGFCAIVGLGGAFTFHWHDAAHYSIYQLHSWSKLFHDFAAYYALLGAGVFLVVPVLFGANIRPGVRVMVTSLLIVAGIILWHEAAYPLPANVYHPYEEWGQYWGRVIFCPSG